MRLCFVEQSMEHANLSPETSIGAVALTVADAKRMADFYRNVIGLRLRREDNQQVVLGAGGRDLLMLHEEPGAVRAPNQSPGLYHLAVLLPSRLALAQSLRHLPDSNAA